MNHDRASASDRLWAAAKPGLIWLIFFFAGPLIGLCAYLLTGGVANIVSPPRPVDGIEVFHAPLNPFASPVKTLQLVILAYPWALLFGGFQAALVGLVAALSYLARGRVSLRAVVIASLVACAGLMAVVSLPSLYNDYSVPPDWKLVALFALVHVIAAAGCWSLVGRLRHRNPRRVQAGAAA